MTGSWLEKLIRFCVGQKFVVFMTALIAAGAGLFYAPFQVIWGLDLRDLPRDPVPVDALPDYGDNQQIVFTEWPGRSPQDIDDQITYPLSSALLGIPGVKTIRSESMLGFSNVYVVFEDDVEFYWSRSRILEKLASLPAGTVPEGVQPTLGPDATALGQIFWYTLEGRDPEGNPAGGWDLEELRSIQDWIVRFGLTAAAGVSEVASVGGYVREYQIDVDPEAMRAYGVTLRDVFSAVRRSNLDVGARTLELNQVEYFIRGIGFLRTLEDIEQTAVSAADGTPIRIRDIAHVSEGPAIRRGVLDKEGAEAVGGVVVMRFGANPLEVIQNVRERIEQLAPGLPVKELDDGTVSRVTIVPFYDRTGLIMETLGTLTTALEQQILITILVVVLMVFHLRSSLIISLMLPLAVLMTFIGMKLAGVEANVVALAGIAIAVGTIVDMGIVITEAVLRRLDEAPEGESSFESVCRGSSEVGTAVLTAMATTIISFLPVFALQEEAGKLFKPLAYTKTFALIAAVVIALVLVPALAHALLPIKPKRGIARRVGAILIAVLGLWLILALGQTWLGLIAALAGITWAILPSVPPRVRRALAIGGNALAGLFVLVVLTRAWEPLGPAPGLIGNLLFVALAAGSVLGFVWVFKLAYRAVLAWCLKRKAAVMVVPIVVLTLGATVWLGFDRVFGWLPESVRSRPGVVKVAHALPGLGQEFMPRLDEGSFLFMPTTAAHISIEEATRLISLLDAAQASIPEVQTAVGKVGRVESALDPAPMSMVETVINYKPEYILDEHGRRVSFKFDRDTGQFVRDEHGELIPDTRGRPYRQWRDHIRTPRDIWDEIARVSRIPGVTDASMDQPINVRIIMVQQGMRASMGVIVKAENVQTAERVAADIERFLKEVPMIEPGSVYADRTVARPYLEIHIDRERIARHGLSIGDVQDVVEVAIGGRPLTQTVEDRRRYPVRVRYMRQQRDSIEDLGRILVPTPDGAQIPLDELAAIEYVKGPEMIRTEDGWRRAVITFSRRPGYAEVSVVRAAEEYLNSKAESGELELPPGVSYSFAGTYKSQVRAQQRLTVILPAVLGIILMILYLQFRSLITASIVFTGVFMAWSGGFVMLWLYGQGWFLDFSLLGANMRELFQVSTINLSVAVWVGFLALFGIATDDGVVMATLLKQTFEGRRTETIEQIREATVIAGTRRARACLMTTATTVLALMPVLTSTGKGADIMVPMAVPIFGGVMVVLLSLFVVPTLYCAVQEVRLHISKGSAT